MEKIAIQNIDELKGFLIKMGGLVEESLMEATKALVERNEGRVDRIEELEAQINYYHVVGDKSCLYLLARLSPFATDLRLILACAKMNSDLERMGDHAANIARGTRIYLKRKEIPMEKDFLKLIEEVRWMVKTSLESFDIQDTEKAKEVLDHDDIVDNLKDEICNKMKELMKKDPQHIDPGIDFILFARNLERIADLSTNISEDVIFIASGKDIRHQQYK